MIIIRPINHSDYESLYQIAIDSGIGFTSLPVNQEILRAKIARSECSFAESVTSPSDQGYLFVMEDTDSGEIVGTSGIEAAVGLNSPFYHYHLGKVVHSSNELKVHNTVETLTLCNDNTGFSEICTLFLKEKARVNGNGRFLSRFRFLFIAEHLQRFSDKIIAEMRGVSDEKGRSPFWAWLEDNFFSIDFPTADYLTGTGNKVFIAELMPKHPIYVSLLSKQAQAVINEVHKNTVPALRLLQTEGFSRSNYVDIFDAGPTISAETQHIRSIQQSQQYQVQIVQNKAIKSAQKYLICNSKLSQFRAIQAEAKINIDEGLVSITEQQAHYLLVQQDDYLRVIAN